MVPHLLKEEWTKAEFRYGRKFELETRSLHSPGWGFRSCCSLRADMPWTISTAYWGLYPRLAERFGNPDESCGQTRMAPELFGEDIFLLVESSDS